MSDYSTGEIELKMSSTIEDPILIKENKLTIYSMSEEEFKIANIKNLSNIFMLLFFLPDQDINPSQRRRGILSLRVSCAKSMYTRDTYSYDEMDELFEQFLSKVINQYKIEKDIRKIELNETAKEFFDFALANEEIKDVEIIDRELGSETSSIVDGVKKYRKFHDIMRYNLNLILTYLEKGHNVKEEVTGFRNQIHLGDKLKIKIDRITEELLEFELIGLYDRLDFVKGKILLSSEKIKFELKTNSGSLSMYSDFLNYDNGVFQSISMYNDNKPSFYDTRLVESKVSKEELEEINKIFNNEISKTEITNVTKLPWGGYFAHDGVNSHYIYKSNDYIIHKFNTNILFSSTVRKAFSNEETKYSITVCEGKGKFESFRLGETNDAITEVYFENGRNPLGVYKKHLRERYFYFDTSFENPNNMTLKQVPEFYYRKPIRKEKKL